MLPSSVDGRRVRKCACEQGIRASYFYCIFEQILWEQYARAPLSMRMVAAPAVEEALAAAGCGWSVGRSVCQSVHIDAPLVVV